MAVSTAPLALRAAKQAISRAPELSLEPGAFYFGHLPIILLTLPPGLDFERASYETLLHTKDRLEALQAFKEKRKPVFKGE